MSRVGYILRVHNKSGALLEEIAVTNGQRIPIKGDLIKRTCDRGDVYYIVYRNGELIQENSVRASSVYAVRITKKESEKIRERMLKECLRQITVEE